MMSALHSFLEIDQPHKLAILGDMLELGQEGPTEHQKVLDFLIENSIKFITVGPIFQKLHPEGYLNATELQNKLQNEKISNCLILLKGSRGIALEELMASL
jgi:UDP-N-acetylmuramoyl-tripeptide--D-alanyl-D-alanine ligase